MNEAKTRPSSEDLTELQDVTIQLPKWCINQLQNMKDFVNNISASGNIPIGCLTVERFLEKYIKAKVTLDGQRLNSFYRF